MREELTRIHQAPVPDYTLDRIYDWIRRDECDQLIKCVIDEANWNDIEASKLLRQSLEFPAYKDEAVALAQRSQFLRDMIDYINAFANKEFEPFKLKIGDQYE